MGYELRGRGHDGSMYAWNGVTSYRKHMMPKAESGVACTGGWLDSSTTFDFANSAKICAEKCAAHSQCTAFAIRDAGLRGRADECALYETCTTRASNGGRVTPRVFKMDNHGDVVCRKEDPVNGRREFKLNQVGHGDRSFVIAGGMETTKGIFGFGDDEVYSVEVWRHTGAWNNAAYTGTGKWLPIAQGKFSFAKVKTNGGGMAVRGDAMGDLYTFLSQDGNDSGELYQSATVPGGFAVDDRICAIPAISSSSARAAETRRGVYENEDGTCTYSVSVTAHAYAGPWSFEYNGSCTGVTFNVVQKDEQDVADGFGGRCGTRFNLKEGVLQVEDNGQTIDWKSLTCANQGFSLTSERVLPTGRRRAEEIPAAAPSNLEMRRFTL